MLRNKAVDEKLMSISIYDKQNYPPVDQIIDEKDLTLKVCKI